MWFLIFTQNEADLRTIYIICFRAKNQNLKYSLNFNTFFYELLNGTLMIKGHESRDLTTKSQVIVIDEEGFGDKFRQVPASIFFAGLTLTKKGLIWNKQKSLIKQDCMTA